MKMKFLKDFEDAQTKFSRKKDDEIWVEKYNHIYLIVELHTDVNRWLPDILFEKNADDTVQFKEKYAYKYPPSTQGTTYWRGTSEKFDVKESKEFYSVKTDDNDYVAIPIEYLEHIVDDK